MPSRMFARALILSVLLLYSESSIALQEDKVYLGAFGMQISDSPYSGLSRETKSLVERLLEVVAEDLRTKDRIVEVVYEEKQLGGAAFSVLRSKLKERGYTHYVIAEPHDRNESLLGDVIVLRWRAGTLRGGNNLNLTLRRELFLERPGPDRAARFVAYREDTNRPGWDGIGTPPVASKMAEIIEELFSRKYFVHCFPGDNGMPTGTGVAEYLTSYLWEELENEDWSSVYIDHIDDRLITGLCKDARNSELQKHEKNAHYVIRGELKVIPGGDANADTIRIQGEIIDSVYKKLSELTTGIGRMGTTATKFADFCAGRKDAENSEPQMLKGLTLYIRQKALNSAAPTGELEQWKCR